MSYYDDIMHYLASPYTAQAATAPQASQPVQPASPTLPMLAGNPTLSMVQPQSGPMGSVTSAPYGSGPDATSYANQAPDPAAFVRPPTRPTSFTNNAAGAGLQAFHNNIANGGGSLPSAPLPPARPQSLNEITGWNNKDHGLIPNILHSLFGFNGLNASSTPRASAFQANAGGSGQNPLQGLGNAIGGLGQGISNGLTGAFNGLFG